MHDRSLCCTGEASTDTVNQPCARAESLSRVQLLETPGTAARQALPSMGFSRQEYWCGLPFPSPIIRGGSPNVCCRMGTTVLILRKNYWKQWPTTGN